MLTSAPAKPDPTNPDPTNPDPTAWIGRSQTITDTLDPVLAGRLAATLGEPAAQAHTPLPLLWHWAFFVEPADMDALGADGHPARGGFLPPAENRNRMWAGGRITFKQPLLLGVPAERRTTILAVTEKTGRTGQLLFVTLRHDYHQAGALAISEKQDIVYRQSAAPKLTGNIAPPACQWRETVNPTPVLLFRYSAATFNGHRIHYDHPYVTQEEGYPGLVVHGPLIATLMVAAFARAQPGARVRELSYRGLRPLIAPAAFTVAGRVLADADTKMDTKMDTHTDTNIGANTAVPQRAELWAEQDGTLAHQATVTFTL